MSHYFDNQYQVMSFGWGAKISTHWTAGLQVPIRSIQGIPKTQLNASGDQGVKIGTVHDQKIMALMTIGRVWEEKGLSFGTSAKIHHHQIMSEKASGLGFDIGVHYRYNHIQLGASIQDLTVSGLDWSTGKKESFDTKINIESELCILHLENN